MTRIALLAAALIVSAPALAETTSAMKRVAPSVAQAPIAKTATESQRLDLNSATLDQLTMVNGLNKHLAEAIVKGRPFKSVDDLATKKILSVDVFSEVKDHFIVR
ncbi:helix-hairpin-helix domain-containing protein [Methylocystis sp. SB2]|uniref:ComEA family DNA-binding protein n=1 Tax=Methylocystis sp. (strain SB2) TaxID=743836 RepID=UPI0004197392|nr:helix-hairpin-helix domain-containing protein [Methylocystis sp. SB2]ULO23789.1 helix-hairpin-helix domain-containing protein [Methylocystis sp. SB2]